ncbi:18233_t:CDS:2, partial [Acaulospora morrowiae]
MSNKERNHIRKLTNYRIDQWKIDLIHLTALNDLDEKLFNTLFPAAQKSLSKHVIPEDLLELLLFGLKFTNPSTIVDQKAQYQEGPSEKTLQAALFASDDVLQAKGYTDDFGINICLVKFILKSCKEPCTLYDVPKEIILA